MSSTDTKIPDIFEFEVGSEGVFFCIPAAKFQDVGNIRTRSMHPAKISDSTEKLNKLLKTCDVAAFATYAGWLNDQQIRVVNLDSAAGSELQEGWVTLIKLAHVAQVMGCDAFDAKVKAGMKMFCLSYKKNFPTGETIRFAQSLIDGEVNSIWVVFAMAWIHHHPSTAKKGNGDGDALYYDLETCDVPHILSFFLVKVLCKLVDPYARKDRILESWTL